VCVRVCVCAFVCARVRVLVNFFYDQYKVIFWIVIDDYDVVVALHSLVGSVRFRYILYKGNKTFQFYGTGGLCPP